LGQQWMTIASKANRRGQPRTGPPHTATGAGSSSNARSWTQASQATWTPPGTSTGASARPTTVQVVTATTASSSGRPTASRPPTTAVVSPTASLDRTTTTVRRPSGGVGADGHGQERAVLDRRLDPGRLAAAQPRHGWQAGHVGAGLDHHRNPDTQKGFADAHGQRPFMVTSFADGTKLSLEAAVLANATGFKVCPTGNGGASAAPRP
jgi:hypothetical protein